MLDETRLLYLACLAYGASYLFVYLGPTRTSLRVAVGCGWLGLALHGASLALRWQRVGHGPFINLYEILSSNLWSLELAFVIFLMLAGAARPSAARPSAARPSAARPVGRYVAPVLAMLLLWLLATEPRDSTLPATYHTVWLYFHVVTGKLFLGLLLLATAAAIFESTRRGAYPGDSPQPAAESTSFRLLAFAFCFQSLMLVFGAVWAQDAWGRYWAWDPLETWAFVTWLGVIFVLHWRLGFAGRRVYAGLVAACFVLAFLTFFGVPFVSTAPHKGMV